jgi:hypothetical protein
MEAHEKAILDELFSEYDDVKPLTEGKSGAGVFRVKGMLCKGDAKRYYVVKIDQSDEITKEEENYKKHILRGETSPPYQILTPIESISENKKTGYLGVVYRDAKNFLVSETVSFRKFWGEQSQKTVEDVENLLSGLIDFYISSLSDETEKEFRDHYTTAVLPFEIRLKWGNPADKNGEIRKLSLKKLTEIANTPIKAEIPGEQWIQCEANFRVVEADEKKIRLNSDGLACKLDIYGYPKPVEVGDSLPSITGQVQQTRIGFLADMCEAYFPGVGWKEESVNICGTTLPNPLFALNDILNADYFFQSAVVHGDLNLENILVGHRYSNPDYVLIDYAKTGRFHALYDFIKLEVDLRTHILGRDEHITPEKLLDFELDLLDDETDKLDDVALERRYYNTLLQRTFSLIKRLRKLAKEGLSENDEMRDYFAGLFCYALATLKFDFDDEKPLQRQSAIIAASVVGAYLQGQSDELLNARREIRRKQLETHPYTYLFLANVGASDLQIQPDLVKAGEDELSSTGGVNLNNLMRYAKRKVNPQDPNQYVELSKAYRDGETINFFYDWFRNKMGAPILKPALTQVLSGLKRGRMRENISISHVYLFATRQSTRASDYDTIYCAEVLCKLIKDNRLAGADGGPAYHQIENLTIEQIGDPPANYSRMWSYFEQKLRDLFIKHDQEIRRVYVCLSGGTPACNTALLLNALQLWGDRCIPVYTERPEVGKIYGQATVLDDFGENLRKSFLRNHLKTLLDKKEYSAMLHFEDEANFSSGFIRLCNIASAFSKEGFSDWQDALNRLEVAEKGFGREHRNTREQIRALCDDLTQQTVLDVEEFRNALHDIILADFHRQF